MNDIITRSKNEHYLSNIQALDKSVRENIEASLAKSTRRVYKLCWKKFSAWCDNNKISSLPASAESLCLFLTEESKKEISMSFLVQMQAAIKLSHDRAGYISPTSHFSVKRTFKGIKRLSTREIVRKSPATVERIESMISHCQTTLIGLRDRALLLIGFAGAFRRSELVALKMNDIERTPEGIKIIIRRSKNDQEGKGQTIAILNGTRFRVVDSLYTWLKEANINEGFLFRQIRRGGNVQQNRLSNQAVAEIVKKYATLSGFNIDNFSGHSLRSGFLTSAASAGAGINKMMEVSRHTDIQTLLGYVRNENLFENHAGEKFL